MKVKCDNMDEEYKKMVLSLPDEFFDGWEYKNGDTILLKENSGWNVYHIGDYLLEDGRIGFIDGWECEFMPEDHEIKPLPNQEQLQEMLINFHMTHNGFSRKRSILHIMGHWADYLMNKHDFEYEKIQRNVDYEEFGDPGDFDNLMLKFTGGIILLVAWDGEKWI
jgi:hypothetical protein